MTTSHRSNKGFSLIEVLIAVFVIAIGVLGVSSAQMISLKNNQSAYYRSQANILIMDMLDRMRANPIGVRDGHYNDIDSNTTYSASNACYTTADGCSPQELADIDAEEWTSQFSSDGDPGLIPGSVGTVETTIDATEVTATVTVTWDENVWDDDQGINVDDEKSLSMTVRM